MITSKKGEWLELTIPTEWSNLTLESLLIDHWQAPRGLVHQWRVTKGIKVNGNAIPWKTLLHPGERLQVHLFVDQEFGVIPEYLELDLIYEDDHVLVVNKPPAIDTHPNHPSQSGTLANGVAFHWQLEGSLYKVRHIHRLDHDTSGGIIFAKNPLSSAILDRMLAKRVIKRTYIAFVEGHVSSSQGTINHPIGRDRHHATRRRVSPGGQEAITHYKVLERFPQHNVSLLELQLDTGRTHQIRVHMSHQGHPLVGDVLYHGNSTLLNRQALHAAKIEFRHPITSEQFTFEIPWPDDLLQLKKKLMR